MTELIKAHDIEIKTKIIGKQIAADHKGDKTPVVMVGLLNGCFAFYSDLVRATPIDMECDFMRVKSYTKRKQGDIQITKDLETSIKGKHVYLVDDILDSECEHEIIESVRMMANILSFESLNISEVI